MLKTSITISKCTISSNVFDNVSCRSTLLPLACSILLLAQTSLLCTLHNQAHCFDPKLDCQSRLAIIFDAINSYNISFSGKSSYCRMYNCLVYCVYAQSLHTSTTATRIHAHSRNRSTLNYVANITWWPQHEYHVAFKTCE